MSVDWWKIAQELWLLKRVLTSPMSRELLLFYATINKSTTKLWVITYFSSAASIFRADLLALLLDEVAEMLFGASCCLNRGGLRSLWESRENQDAVTWERMKPKGLHSIFSGIIKYRCLKACFIPAGNKHLRAVILWPYWVPPKKYLFQAIKIEVQGKNYYDITWAPTKMPEGIVALNPEVSLHCHMNRRSFL